MPTLHDTDFYSWTQQQAALLRDGNLSALDIANLIEEIEDMGRGEKRELKHRLTVLIAHLLKLQYQPNRRGSSWEVTIEAQRFEVDQCLLENPGLKPALLDIFKISYHAARLLAIKETLLPKIIFPLECPWTFEQVLDNEFWPD